MVRRYARIYLACVRNCVVRELEFRTNFLFTAVANVSWALLSMLMAGMIFGNVREVAGWDLNRMFILIGVFVLIEHVTGVFFKPNMERLSELVNRGELDFVLTKPMSSQFLVSTRYVDLRDVPGIPVALFYIVYGLNRVGAQPSAVEVGMFGLLLLCGIISVYAVWFMTVTLSLWTGRWNNIAYAIIPVMDMARVPTDVFRGVFRPLVTFVIPIALVGTLPSQAILGILEPGMVAYQVAFTGIVLWGSHWFWNYSLKHYSSASS